MYLAQSVLSPSQYLRFSVSAIVGMFGSMSLKNEQIDVYSHSGNAVTSAHDAAAQRRAATASTYRSPTLLSCSETASRHLSLAATSGSLTSSDSMIPMAFNPALIGAGFGSVKQDFTSGASQ